METSFIALIEQSIRTYWDYPALSDYKGKGYTYMEVAREIEKLHSIFRKCKIKPGERIALCGRNSAMWGIVFLATLTYGAVAIPILHEFKAGNIHHIINHSEARILFIGDSNWETIEHGKMPDLEAVVRIENLTIRIARNEQMKDAFSDNRLTPTNISPNDVNYERENPTSVAIINYTSGTTSSSKGVMLPYRSMWSNLCFAIDKMGYAPGEKLVAILTMAHMYGLAFEFIYPFAAGMHIYFLSRTPSPHIIADAFTTVKPNLIVAVPLIIEKVIRRQVLPKLKKPHIQLFLKIPYLNSKIKRNIRQRVLNAFGGRFKLLAVGGAALNHEVETFLASIQFPYTVGYGMTECGPGISFDKWETFKQGSCGKAVDRMDVRIDSDDPRRIVGEIMVRGMNVMLGYYKNQEATDEAFESDGWMHTGDLAVMDGDGYIYIKGRSKNMILGSSGQNIYPEEIEDKLNVMPYVSESLVIERNGKLVALVYPDHETAAADKLSPDALTKQLNHNRTLLNDILPGYSQISRIEVMEHEFEKTPKKSIKRFLYT